MTIVSKKTFWFLPWFELISQWTCLNQICHKLHNHAYIMILPNILTQIDLKNPTWFLYSMCKSIQQNHIQPNGFTQSEIFFSPTHPHQFMKYDICYAKHNTSSAWYSISKAKTNPQQNATKQFKQNQQIKSHKTIQTNLQQTSWRRLEKILLLTTVKNPFPHTLIYA